MIIALVGVSGVGKTYFTKQAVNKLNFSPVKTIRSRKKRENEDLKNVGLFYTLDQIKELEKQGKIGITLKLFGNTYAYLKKDLLSNDNKIFEMHYTKIEDVKKVNKNVKTIYIFPNDINNAINEVKKRNLPKDLEQSRIKEMYEQFEKMKNNEDLRSRFDYLIQNNYDIDSEKKILNLIKQIVEVNK